MKDEKDETALEMEEAFPLQETDPEISRKAEDYSGVLPPHSMKTKCLNCSANVSSVVVQTLRKDLWLWPIFFCCCGFIPCFCCIYPIRNWFMEWRHYCGKCEKELAIYKQPLTRGVTIHLILGSVFGSFPALLIVYVLGKYMGFWGMG